MRVARRWAAAAAACAATGLVIAGSPAEAATGWEQHAASPSRHWAAPAADSGRQMVRPVQVPVGSPKGASLAPLRRLLQADLLIVGPRTLPAGLLATVRKLPGVVAGLPVDAGRIRIDGTFADLLGVNAAQFRAFAAAPTARATGLWSAVASGGMAVSYTMGKDDKLPLGESVRVAGATTSNLPLAGFGTTGIAGVDAVVNADVARTLGLPQANAIVISAPHTGLAALMAKIRTKLPAGASVAALVTQVTVAGSVVTTGAAGGVGISGGRGLTATQLAAFLAAARSRVGFPYVWGAAGPKAFDCSGLVQWSMAQAGVLMPRVAADQARTGPLVPPTELQPGDLLFYHLDPTAPSYISHVAIYLGNGQMLQAPEPGMNVQIVTADFGAGFAGAVRVVPVVASAVAGNPAG